MAPPSPGRGSHLTLEERETEHRVGHQCPNDPLRDSDFSSVYRNRHLPLSLSSLSLFTLPFDRLSLSYKMMPQTAQDGNTTPLLSLPPSSLSSLSKQFGAAAEQPRNASARREGAANPWVAFDGLDPLARGIVRRARGGGRFPPRTCSPPPLSHAPPSSPVAIAAGIPD